MLSINKYTVVILNKIIVRFEIICFFLILQVTMSRSCCIANYVSEYYPKPKIDFNERILPHEGYKLKVYNNRDHVDSIRFEFERLHAQKYTHVANMPGDFREILYMARCFQINILDWRMGKYVAEECSKKIRNFKEV